MAYQPRNPESQALYRGRVCSYRTPGRAGTTGQKIFSLFNASASSRVVHINQIAIDLYQTAAKTVAPPIIRIHRVTSDASSGTALTKVAKDTSLSSSASITVKGDASTDGTSSASALTHASVTVSGLTTCLTEEFAPRVLSLVGYEPFDRTELLEGKDIILRGNEGIVVFLDYTVATSNPTTDMYIVTCDWWEI